MSQDETINNAVDVLVQKLRAERGGRHPFAGHPLENSNDFVRNKYLQTLAALALYKSEGGEDRKLFFDRLAAGAKAEFDTERYFGMARDIKEETLGELMKSLSGAPALKNAFALDSLLLCYIEGVSEGQAEFLAELLDASGVSEEEFAALLKLAEAILRLDTDCLPEALCRYASVGVGSEYGHYLELFHISPDQAAKLAEGFDGDGLVVKLSLDGLINENNTFVKGGRIMFVNCDFTCPMRLFFDKFDEVIFQNCGFRDFNKRTVILNDVGKASFKGCKFENCWGTYSDTTKDWAELGGVICAKLGEKALVTIKDCKFTDCGGKNEQYYFRSSIISNASVDVSETEFQNCWHIHDYLNNGGSRDPDNSQRRLFSHVVRQENNKLEDSAKLV